MSRTEFIKCFTEKLKMLPHGEVEKSLLFYTEIIDDRVEDGMSEEEAVAALGDINEIVHEIMLTVPLSSLVKAKMKPKHKLSTWEIVLIILGFPLWFPLLVGFFMLVFSVYIAVWSVIISLYAGVLAFLISGVAGIVASFVLMPTNPATGLLLLGGSILSIGLGIFSFIGVKNLSVWLIGLTARFLRVIKSLFINTETEGDVVHEAAY